MKKITEKDDHKNKIEKVYLKLKQFLFIDGNYKKRNFIVNNMTNNTQTIYKKYLDEIKSLELYSMINEDSDYFPFINRNAFSNEVRLFQLFIAIAYNLFFPDNDSNLLLPEQYIRQYKYNNRLLYNFLNHYRCDISYITKFLNPEENDGTAASKLTSPQGMERIQNFIDFTNLSIKYGLYINDLFSDITNIGIDQLKDWINEENINDADIYYPFPTIDFINKVMNIEQFDGNHIAENRLYGALDKICKDDELERIHRASIIRALTGSRVFSEMHTSFKTRKLGLYLWDMCKNPLNANKIDFKILSKDLYTKDIYLSSTPDDFRRLLRMYFIFTDKCIQNGKYLPYKHKKSI